MNLHIVTLQSLSLYLKELETHEPKWHKTCYASFTSKANIQSLVNRSGHDGKQGPSTSETPAHDKTNSTTSRFLSSIFHLETMSVITFKTDKVNMVIS